MAFKTYNMDIIKHTTPDKEEHVYYSEQYLENELYNAYRAGLMEGCKIEIHLTEPNNHETAIDYISVFFREIEKVFQNTVSKHIKKYSINNTITPAKYRKDIYETISKYNEWI